MRLGLLCTPHRPKSFNPRTRVGCDPNGLLGEVGKLRFQSTHPRGVRQVTSRDAHNCSYVSIHAPAWGATVRGNAIGLEVQVSIHAPAWGATLLVQGSLFQSNGFNPRTRVGCDPQTNQKYKMKSSFNPRTRVGCDFHAPRSRVEYVVSIHAPAWGATTLLRPSIPPVMFQSTHPRGVRQTYHGLSEYRDRVSIHAPAWGAT